MTKPQEEYNNIMFWIDNCESLFQLKCADLMVDLFASFFPEEKDMRQMLIDVKSDKYQEVFNHGKDKIHN